MKAWRTQENQRLRHNAKILINNCLDYDALIIPVLDDYDTLWGSPQDGRKHWQEKPLLNQCVVDSYNHYHRRFWWARVTPTLLKAGEHDEDYCNCYGNKRGWYWKNLRK